MTASQEACHSWGFFRFERGHMELNIETAARTCSECNAGLEVGRKRFCSTLCATRQRVRRHRLKSDRLDAEGQAHIAIRRRQTSGVVRQAQVSARKKLRGVATERRRELKRELKRQNRELTQSLARDIKTSDATILRAFETKIAQEFDREVIAIAIAQHDKHDTTSSSRGMTRR
jgi:hypothetical protein